MQLRKNILRQIYQLINVKLKEIFFIYLINKLMYKLIIIYIKKKKKKKNYFSLKILNNK